MFVHSIECNSFNESNWGKLKKKRSKITTTATTTAAAHRIVHCAHFLRLLLDVCKKLKGKFVCSSALLFIARICSLSLRFSFTSLELAKRIWCVATLAFCCAFLTLAIWFSFFPVLLFICSSVVFFLHSVACSLFLVGLSVSVNVIFARFLFTP